MKNKKFLGILISTLLGLGLVTYTKDPFLLANKVKRLMRVSFYLIKFNKYFLIMGIICLTKF